jgi:hypothetical protein
MMLRLLTTALIATAGFTPFMAQAQDGQRPGLVVTNAPIPKEILSRAYSKPVEVRDITPQELMGRQYYKPTETVISRKIQDLGSELAILQDKVSVLTDATNSMQRVNEGKAADYYAAVATINTQLQAGTTPGNPRLLNRLTNAETALEEINQSLNDMNNLAIDTSRVATEATFLLEASRSAYNLSGAVEEDHVQLATIEDKINGTLVVIERLLNTINSDVSRTNAYLSAERDNLRTLSLAVTSGDLYGSSLAYRPFAGMQNANASIASVAPAPMVAEAVPESYPNEQIAYPQETAPVAPQAPAAAPAAMRPLVKIRFDRPNVDYEQAVYMAVNEALERYPNASFSVVAVHPSIGNAAEVAIESTRARRNADKVLRTLSQIGLSPSQIDVSYDQSPEINDNEVRIFIR